MNKLAVFVNNENVFEFNSGLTFEDQQLAFLDKMDTVMDSGIKIQRELLVNPDNQQPATFVVMNLIKALQQDNEAVLSTSCAYLVNRHPALIEVRANDYNNALKIELIEAE